MNVKYNSKSPAVKRLMREAAELSQPAPEYFAAPLEDNLFEWHFTVRGPSDTDFQDGVYHGRIIVPSEYPMKPPDIILLTPNGRFEIGKKICLSISGYHPETWQPSWSIRTALLAIIGFMPTEAKGFEVGAVQYSGEERRKLAARSQDWTCPTCQVKPVNLLASKEQERQSNVIKDEVDEIVNKLQLKESTDGSKQNGEEGNSSSMQKTSKTSHNTSQNISQSSESSLITSDEQTTEQTAQLSEHEQDLHQQIVHDISENSSGSMFGVQFTDVLIFVLLVVVAVLLYRRFTGQAFRLLGSTDNTSPGTDEL